MRQLTKRQWRLILLASSALLSVLPMVATAQSATNSEKAATSGDEPNVEIIVTAERRSTTLQKTPTSMTVMNGKDLAERGKNGLGQILEDTPGVSVAAGAGIGSDSPGTSVVIRGVQPDSLAGGSSTAAPTTAAYTDQVFSGIGGEYDISRVEVLRGPQGTLYGRSATSGVVNTLTQDPKLGNLGGDILAEGGTASLKHVSGAINVPLGDKVAVRLSGNNYIRDGYDSAEGGHLVNTGERLKILFKPTDNIRLLIGAAGQNQVVNSGGTALVATGADTYTDSDTSVGSKKYKSSQYWAQLDWDLGWANLTYIPTYRKWSTAGTTVIGPDIIHETAGIPQDDFTTHELRLTSPSQGRFTWLVGAFYYHNAYENTTTDIWWHSQALTWTQDVNKRTTNVGIFGEGTYQLGDKTRLTAGLRFDETRVATFGYYTSNNATPAAGATPFDSDWFLPEVLSTASLTREQGTTNYSNTTFKLRLEHDLTAHNILYGTIATGFLPGDSQFTTTSAGAVALPYDQEKLTAYEIGSKNRFMEGRLTINGDLYYYDYSGYQSTVNTSGNASSPFYAVLTAPAKMWGGEIEGRWMITRTDTINLAYGHTDAKYDDPSAEFQTYVAQENIPGISPDTVSIGYEHGASLAGGFVKTHLDLRYSAARDLGAITPDQVTSGLAGWNRAQAATLGDADITWTSPQGSYSVTLYGRNLGDKRVRTSFLFQDSSITLSDPRTFGLVLQAHY
ncbi:MAG: TonB-dependent receptor [Asticcacaulis sp.]|uniref:TonB-dependent receptor n=1 Tax=Asticcacaulis sp. TaxID=1872648 RepID=UPI0039E5CFE1